MRTHFRAMAFVLAMMASGSGVPASFAGGKVIGNGGNEAALELETAGKAAIQNLTRFSAEFPEVDPTVLTKLLNGAQILVSSEPLIIEFNGISQESTAINRHDPDTIIVNEKRWKSIQTDTIRQALALHELLGLAGLEKTGDYPISRRYLAKLGIQCENGLCDSTPSYQCLLIRNPKTMPEYLVNKRLGGNGNSDILHLVSGSIHAQILISVGPMGSELMINLYDGDMMVNTLEMPRSPFPRSLNLFWRKSAKESWAVNCSR